MLERRIFFHSDASANCLGCAQWIFDSFCFQNKWLVLNCFETNIKSVLNVKPVSVDACERIPQRNDDHVSLVPIVISRFFKMTPRSGEDCSNRSQMLFWMSLKRLKLRLEFLHVTYFKKIDRHEPDSNPVPPAYQAIGDLQCRRITKRQRFYMLTNVLILYKCQFIWLFVSTLLHAD